MNTDSNKSV